MESVGIDELKRRLSELIREAENGARVIVTRHNRPVVVLSGIEEFRLHRGRRVGGGGPTPAVSRGSQGAYLQVLEEDRRGSTD